MAALEMETYPLEPTAILNKAPSDSGVFILSTPRRCVYVGDSNNIRQSLLEFVNAPTASFERFGPLSFSSEVVASSARKARREELTAALEPSGAFE